VLAREACEFIDRHRAEPFFLFLAFNAVHTPMEAPSETEAKVSGISDPQRRTYLAMLAELDLAVGQVLAKVREANLDEQTIIFFLSDNGGPTVKFSPNGSRNAPLRGSKGDTWEGGIRVPFLVRWTNHLPAGKLYEPNVISLDISTTALAAAGIKPEPSRHDGVDLVPFLSGKDDDAPHEFLYWRFGKQMAVRSGDWKLVRPSMQNREYQDVSWAPLLFNLKDDIAEAHDLAAQNPDKVKELQTAYDHWDARLQPPRWPATLKGKPFVEH
jgi:arylsulfatase A-like enzyme